MFPFWIQAGGIGRRSFSKGFAWSAGVEREKLGEGRYIDSLINLKYIRGTIQ
jgi:hypothetical protein